MPVIEYLPGNSFFHKLDPRVKIIFLLSFAVFIFTTRNFYIISVILALALFLWITSGIPIAKIINIVRLMLPIFIFVIIVQALFQVGHTNLVSPLIPKFVPLIGGRGRITLEGTIFGLVIGYRLLTLIILMPLISMTTDINTLCLGMVKMGMSYKIAYTATIAINMIPSMEEQIMTVMDAQKLRGFAVFEEGRIHEKMKAYPTLVVPMVIGAMKKSMLMSVAMDARAFGSKKTRTYIDKIAFTATDYSALIMLIILLGILSYYNFIR